MDTALSSKQQVSSQQPPPSGESGTICINDRKWRYHSTSGLFKQCAICANDVVSKLICIAGHGSCHGSCQRCFRELTVSSRNTRNCFICRRAIAPAMERVKGDTQLNAAIAEADFFCIGSQCQWQGKYHQLTLHQQQHALKGGDKRLPLTPAAAAQPADQPEPDSTSDCAPQFAQKYALICQQKVFGYLNVFPDRDIHNEVLSNVWEVRFTQKPATAPAPSKYNQTLMDKAHLWSKKGTPYYSVRGNERNLLTASKSGLTELTYQDQYHFIDLDLLPSINDLSGSDNLSDSDLSDSDLSDSDLSDSEKDDTTLSMGFMPVCDNYKQNGATADIEICGYIPLSKRRRTDEYEFQQYSAHNLEMTAADHNNPNMNLYLLMGANHERLLGRVCSTGEDSEPFCYASGFDCLENSPNFHSPYALGGNYLTPQKDKHGLVTAVIQKDPPDDRHPCGYEIHFNLDAERRLWESVRFIKPGHADMVLEAQNLEDAAT